MARDSTKEEIIEVSLNLFSQRGFTAVSIRDICREVRIRESSVYYHFKNKQAILEELQRRFGAAAMRRMKQLEDAMAGSLHFSKLSGENIAKIFFEDYLMDDFCNKFIRLLQIERRGNEHLGRLYDQWMFDEPLRFQSKVFSFLTKQKQKSSASSEDLAVKFYSPIFLFCERYLLSGELTEEKKEMFRRKAYTHFYNFFSENEVI